MLCSRSPRFLLFFFFTSGRLCCRAVRVEAFSPLPFAEDGLAVEPRSLAAASTSFWCDPPPRRSLRREREARELIALSKLVHDTRQLAALVRQAQQSRPSPRRAREARQLQQVMLLAAALRRAGFPR